MRDFKGDIDFNKICELIKSNGFFETSSWSGERQFLSDDHYQISICVTKKTGEYDIIEYDILGCIGQFEIRRVYDWDDNEKYSDELLLKQIKTVRKIIDAYYDTVQAEYNVNGDEEK